MSSQTSFTETHVFSTGIDDPTFINVSIDVKAPSLEAAEVAVSHCRCSLVCVGEELGLYRDGELYAVSLLNMTFDVIPESVRADLGKSFDSGEPGALEQAVAGLKYGPLTIQTPELQRVSFNWQQITEPPFADLINRSGHIAYEVEASFPHPSTNKGN